MDKEAAYVFDKSYKCEVCEREFKAKQIRTGKARFIGTDDILKPLYSNVDTCKYDIIMCPFCGYATTQRNFGQLTAKQRQALRENVATKFKVTWEEGDTYSYDAAIRRTKMALLTEMVIYGKISEASYICLKLAWLYRGLIAELLEEGVPEEFVKMFRKSEHEYIVDAYKGFKEAIATEYPPIAGMDENTVNYLVASLAVQCGELTEAKQFASRILGSRSANAKLKDKTRMLVEQIKKEE